LSIGFALEKDELMVKRMRARRKKDSAPPSTPPPPPAREGTAYGASSLHDLFEQQARAMLDRTDLDEEHKQSILAAMSCPCCGGGAMSYTVKLKR
jgi:hypothetical protein